MHDAMLMQSAPLRQKRRIRPAWVDGRPAIAHVDNTPYGMAACSVADAGFIFKRAFMESHDLLALRFLRF